MTRSGREKTILLEGQLGSLKDPTWEFIRWSPLPLLLLATEQWGAGGIPPYAIQQIITVVKVFPAPWARENLSLKFWREAEELRKRGGDGGEYGATTGRPRRMGWLDLVAARYGCVVQGATDVAFTVLDALGYLDEIPVWWPMSWMVNGSIPPAHRPA